MKRFNMIVVPVASALVWASSAGAADLQGSSFVAGLAHPLSGLDHILVMMTVGVWGVLAGGRALWVWPTAFVATMLTGFAGATLGLQLPYVGAAVASSIVVLGLLVAFAVKAPLWLGAAIVALFAFFHGHAHGTEAAEVGRVAFGAGFAFTTAGLHVSGIGLGLFAERWMGRAAMRVIGALTLGGGLALIGG